MKPEPNDGYVNVTQLVEILFPNPKARPSVRAIRRLQKARKIPVVKLGRLTYFEPDRVRAALRRLEVPVQA